MLKDKYTWIETTFSDGTKYMGEALENNQVPDGYGVITWLDGSQYVGMFRNGLAHGTGIRVNTDYSYTLGEWENGLLITTLETGPSAQ